MTQRNVTSQQQSMLVILPVEILFRICSYLDSPSLIALGRSHRHLKDVIGDDAAWKGAFLNTFGTVQHVPTVHSTWREIMLDRTAQLQLYARGRGKNHVYDAKVGMITHSQRLKNSSLVLACNVDTGSSSLSELKRGKVFKDSILHVDVELDVTCIEVDAGLVLYGLHRGRILFYKLSRSKLQALQVLEPVLLTTIIVKMKIVVDFPHTDGIAVLSGDTGGYVGLWVINGTVSCKFRQFVTELIIHIEYDAVRDQIYVLDASCTVTHLTKDLTVVHQVVLPVVVSDRSADDATFDLAQHNVFLQFDSEVVGYDLTSGQCTVRISPPFSGEISCYKLGPECLRLNATSQPQPRLLAVADTLGDLAIYNCRDSAAQPVSLVKAHTECVTAIGLNYTVVVTSSLSGNIHVFDLLTGQPLKPICHISEKVRRVSGEAILRTQIREIVLEDHLASGYIVAGNTIRFFDWTARSSGRTDEPTSTSGSNASYTSHGKARYVQEIKSEMASLEAEHEEDEQIRLDNIAAYSGPLAASMTAQELLQYAQLLSLDSTQDSQKVGSSRQGQGQEDEDGDLMLAMALSESMMDRQAQVRSR